LVDTPPAETKNSEQTGKSGHHKKRASIPIVLSKNPDFMALAGIWKDNDITLEELRKKAWGDRP